MTAAQAVLYVHDLQRMVAFYEGCPGLRRVADDDGYAELRADGWTVWILRTPQAHGSGARRSQIPVKLCFAVESIAAARATAAQLGGEVDEREWEFGGWRRCDAVDPEGNIIQLVEPCSG